MLEAYAAGMPVVSTTVGAEGLAEGNGETCLPADEPQAFVAKVLQLLEDPSGAAALAGRARAEVVEHWDMATITARLAESYREAVREKRRAEL